VVIEELEDIFVMSRCCRVVHESIHALLNGSIHFIKWIKKDWQSLKRKPASNSSGFKI